MTQKFSELKTENFARYVEDWYLLSPESQQQFFCNYLGLQNNFHYSANLLLTQVDNHAATDLQRASFAKSQENTITNEVSESQRGVSNVVIDLEKSNDFNANDPVALLFGDSI